MNGHFIREAFKSMSGDWRCARLECGSCRARLDGRCIDRRMRKFEDLRDRQRRRRRRHGRACQSDNGANRAKIIRMLIGVATGRRKLLSGLDRRRGLRRNCVEMAERQCKLNDERKKRKPRAKSDLRPDPLHADSAPRRKPPHPVGLRRYKITSQARRFDVNCQRQKTIREL